MDKNEPHVSIFYQVMLIEPVCITTLAVCGESTGRVISMYPSPRYFPDTYSTVDYPVLIYLACKFISFVQCNCIFHLFIIHHIHNQQQ